MHGGLNVFLVYNEHKNSMDFEKKLSKTLAFPSQYVMIKSAKLNLAKIKKVRRGGSDEMVSGGGLRSMLMLNTCLFVPVRWVFADFCADRKKRKL